MLIVVFGGIFFTLKVINEDPGQLVGYAVGKPDAAGVSELQILIPMTAPIQDPVTRFTASGKPDWDHWLNQRFVVTDPSGTVVSLRKGGFKSADIDEMKAGSAEFIALADLTAGVTYDVEFIPVVGQPEKYTIQIAGAAKEFRREYFVPDY
ncbi:MAG: hypothetical protein AAFX76_01060 [Planctomycetota bacterium]